jgi:hypothetical protein
LEEFVGQPKNLKSVCLNNSQQEFKYSTPWSLGIPQVNLKICFGYPFKNFYWFVRSKEQKMKKRSLKLIVVLIVALLVIPVSAVSADSNGPYECVLDITYDQHDPENEPGVFYWLGTLSDCDLAGAIRFDAVPEEYAYPGKTMHFVEEFIIWPDSGGEIKGKNWGVWNLSTFKFRANGWVRETSPEWADLVGAKYHEIGTTTPFTGTEIPIFAPDGAMKLVPANRQPHALP